MIPLEIKFRNIPDSRSARQLVEEKVEGLRRICPHMQSCRVVLDQPHSHSQQYHVRIDITVPTGNEVVVNREPTMEKKPQPLSAVVRDAFRAARAQIQELVRKQRGEFKHHSEKLGIELERPEHAPLPELQR